MFGILFENKQPLPVLDSNPTVENVWFGLKVGFDIVKADLGAGLQEALANRTQQLAIDCGLILAFTAGSLYFARKAFMTARGQHCERRAANFVYGTSLALAGFIGGYTAYNYSFEQWTVKPDDALPYLMTALPFGVGIIGLMSVRESCRPSAERCTPKHLATKVGLYTLSMIFGSIALTLLGTKVFELSCRGGVHFMSERYGGLPSMFQLSLRNTPCAMPLELPPALI